MRVLATLAVLLLAPLAALFPTAAAECPGFAFVPGQGPSCPVDGGWEVLLPDGSRVFTHGYEGTLVAGNPLSLTNPPASQPVVCVNTVTQYSIRVVLARPADFPDRSAVLKPQIRAVVEQVNGLLRAEAALYGETANLRVYCTSGQIEVTSLRLPTASGADSFNSIIGELRQIGLNGNTQKYWVFYDDVVACGGCTGQANMRQDDRLAFDNLNNAPTGGSQNTNFAISYGVVDAGVAAHELFHILGAVQTSAPRSTAANHCTDGLDVMCFSDGGAYSGTVCTDRTHLDCGGDDYFRPMAPVGSYLRDHWNLGSHLVKFLSFGTETAPPTVAFAVPQMGKLHTNCDAGVLYPPGRAAVKGPLGCIRLALADASGIAKVELRVNGVLVGTDTSGSTTPTFTFPISATKVDVPVKVDAYDARGNYVAVNSKVDLVQ